MEAPRSPQEEAAAAPSHKGREAVVIDRTTIIINDAKAEYLLGEDAFRAGEYEEARDHFDAAVLHFLDSGEDIGSNSRLQAAFDGIIADIRAMESQIEIAGDESAQPEEVPVDTIDEITSDISAAEQKEERRKVQSGADLSEHSIPVVLNDRVLTFIDAFENTPRFRDAFRGGYQRMGRYEPMIRKVLAEEGVPQDLIYLAFIESTFKPTAYSRARARGMWQFMAATGSRYGLQSSHYLDERSDPEKATRAAARYLRDLYAEFGDWYLAMASYNAGEAKVRRAIARTGKHDFWEIARTKHLRQETKNFVPSILALSIISRDPAKYGHGDLVKEPPMKYDWVVVDGPTDLGLIARLTDTDSATIETMNPHIRRGITPPGVDSFKVRVPAGAGPRFQSAYAELPDSEKIARVMTPYTVRPGDTLSTIARRQGTTVAAITQVNGISSRTRIYAGSTLLVPRGGVESEWRRRDSGWSGGKAGADGVYTVVRGDTLSSIAGRHGMRVSDIAEVNEISERSILHPGQKLQVVSAGEKSARPSEEVRYTVRPGDSLSRIARLHGTSVPALESLNGLDRRSTLYPGQRLRIHPGSSGGASAAAALRKVDYKVRSGDSLYEIATRYGTTVDELRAWNNMGNQSRIFPGQVLRLYLN
jgi:membrane-bound lytic murein transglycosylase D